MMGKRLTLAFAEPLLRSLGGQSPRLALAARLKRLPKNYKRVYYLACTALRVTTVRVTTVEERSFQGRGRDVESARASAPVVDCSLKPCPTQRSLVRKVLLSQPQLQRALLLPCQLYESDAHISAPVLPRNFRSGFQTGPCAR